MGLSLDKLLLKHLLRLRLRRLRNPRAVHGATCLASREPHLAGQGVLGVKNYLSLPRLLPRPRRHHQLRCGVAASLGLHGIVSFRHLVQ